MEIVKQLCSAVFLSDSEKFWLNKNYLEGKIPCDLSWNNETY